MDLRPHEVFVIVRPSKFRRANLMAALTLRSITLSRDVKCVLADLPRGLEIILKQYERAGDVLSRAVELGLLYWSESMVKAYEPIVSCLSRLIKDGVRVTCYLDPLELKRERELAFKVSRLVLRATIKELDEQDLKEWIQILNEYAFDNREAFNRLIDSLEEVEGLNVAILTGLEGLQYFEKLRDQGFKVRLEVTGLPYLRNPLEVMILKHSRGELTINELRALVREYVDYIRNYVVRCESLEEAHEKWSCDRAPWLKSLIPSNIEDDNANAMMPCP